MSGRIIPIAIMTLRGLIPLSFSGWLRTVQEKVDSSNPVSPQVPVRFGIMKSAANSQRSTTIMAVLFHVNHRFPILKRSRCDIYLPKVTCHFGQINAEMTWVTTLEWSLTCFYFEVRQIQRSPSSGNLSQLSIWADKCHIGTELTWVTYQVIMK